MSILTKATNAKSARTPESQKIVYVYVFVLIVLILAQLFSYDDFVRLIESFWLPGGVPTAHFLSGFVVICELFALPFLLRMKISPIMRYVSMVSGWIVPLAWLFLTLWINLTVNSISNVGFLGSVIQLVPGWWAVCVSLAIGLLAGWSSWGLWPGKNIN